MKRIRESVEIDAPAERVWEVVHEDVKNAKRWSSNLQKTEVLDPLPLRKGSRLRHHLETPGGVQQIEVEHTTVSRPRTAAGKLVKGPLKGTFKYSYAEKDGRTRVTYEMEYEATGLARFFSGVIDRQLPADLATTLQALKKYVESGRQPARRRS